MLVNSFFKSVADYLESAKTLVIKPFDRVISAASSLSERYNFHSAENTKSEKFSHIYIFPENYSADDHFKILDYLQEEYDALYDQRDFGKYRSPFYIFSKNHKILGIKVEFDSPEALIYFRNNTYDFTIIKQQEKMNFSPQT